MADAIDNEHMARALQLAANGLYDTAPNPAVGCVLVKDARVVGTGGDRPCKRTSGKRNEISSSHGTNYGLNWRPALSPRLETRSRKALFFVGRGDGRNGTIRSAGRLRKTVPPPEPADADYRIR